MILRIASIRLWREQRGSSAAEFALVLPVMLLFIFGIIDAGWFAWQINFNEKATQMGARMAVVTGPVATGLTGEDYVGKDIGGVVLTQGDQIPAGALGLITCTSSGCACTTNPCPDTPGHDGNAFDRIASRMASMNSQIQPENVVVEYRGSGLGFAGDPGGMEIAPLTTVKVQNLQYTPLSFMLIGQQITLPSFAYTLTMEDGSGERSN